MTKGLRDISCLEPLKSLALGQQVFAIIAEAGGEARYVGGVIRDLLAGMDWPQYPDLDMAMTLTPDAATDALASAGLRVLPTGIDHGTITVFDRSNDKLKIEMTTLRHDVDTDGRHATVAFTNNWHDDAARRDFTFNSIYMDSDGVLDDPFDGQGDLAKGITRFIGDAEMRLAEDYLRLLRYFRFHARFGKGKPDAETLAILSNAKENLVYISGERIANEMGKLLSHGPSEALKAMAEIGVDEALGLGRFNIDRFEKLHSVDADLALPAVYSALVDNTALLSQRMKLPVKMQKKMGYLSAAMDRPEDLASSKWQQKAWHEQAQFHTSEPSYLLAAHLLPAHLLAARYAIAAVKQGQEISPKAYKNLKQWDAPEFPVKGRDLMAIGFETGTAMGEALNKLEADWVAGGFSMTKEELLKTLKS